MENAGLSKATDRSHRLSAKPAGRTRRRSSRPWRTLSRRRLVAGIDLRLQEGPGSQAVRETVQVAGPSAVNGLRRAQDSIVSG